MTREELILLWSQIRDKVVKMGAERTVPPPRYSLYYDLWIRINEIRGNNDAKLRIMPNETTRKASAIEQEFKELLLEDLLHDPR